MSDRPRKLTPMALNVVWGSQVLTLAEKVVFYHDWVLDQGGPDGSFISHKSMAARLALTEQTVAKTRQRLRQLMLHEAIRRPDARNLGWISTIPAQCVPPTYRDTPACIAAFDTFLHQLEAWKEGSAHTGSSIPDRVEAGFQSDRNREAAALGGRGEVSSQASMRETQLPSEVREKGVSADADDEKRGTSEAEIDAMIARIDQQEAAGELTKDIADRLRRFCRKKKARDLIDQGDLKRASGE